MTERRLSQGIRKLGTLCAPFVFCVAAQAGPAWDMFEARCLDPFEHQAEAIVDGLAAQPVEQMHEAQLVFAAADGALLVLDAAPTDGNRACSVVMQGDVALDPAYLAWAGDVTARQVYVAQGGVLASAEWIEPQVHVVARLDTAGATYRVLETDLES